MGRYQPGYGRGGVMALEASPVDWPAARRAVYLVKQTFRYEYPEPIKDLNHRLVVIPPERFGHQHRLNHQLSIALDGVRFEDRQDRYGNFVVDVVAARVPASIEFVAEVAVERFAAQPHRLPKAC